MPGVFSTISTTIRRRPFLFIVASVAIYTLFFALRNGALAFSYFDLTVLSPIEKLKYALAALYTHEGVFSPFIYTMIILTSLVQGVAITLLVTYIKERGSLLSKDSTLHGIGFILAMIGTHCAACGGVIITTLLSLGISASFFTALPYGGNELSVIALFIVIVLTYTLAKKVARPNVC